MAATVPLCQRGKRAGVMKVPRHVGIFIAKHILIALFIFTIKVEAISSSNDEIATFNPKGKLIGASCSGDSDCKDYLICHFDHDGRDGQCKTAYYNSTGANLDALCNNDNVCAGYTRCVHELCQLPSLAQPCGDACYGALICGKTNRCRPPVYGDPCTAQWMCPEETSCRNGVCRNPKLGDICDEADLHCGNGMRCDKHICVVRSKGDACAKDIECTGGLACIERKCARRLMDTMKVILAIIILIFSWIAAYIYVYNSIDNDDTEVLQEKHMLIENGQKKAVNEAEDMDDNLKADMNANAASSPHERRMKLFRRQNNEGEQIPLLSLDDGNGEPRQPLLRNLVRSISRREQPGQTNA